MLGVQLCMKISPYKHAAPRGPLLRTSVAKQINKAVVKAIHRHTVHSSVKEQVMSFDVTINYNMQHVRPWRPKAGKHFPHDSHTKPSNA